MTSHSDSAVYVFSTLFGRPMIVGRPGQQAPAEVGLLWLAPGDAPPSAFASIREAESAIRDTMDASAGQWTERASYTLEDPRRRRQKLAKKGTEL